MSENNFSVRWRGQVEPRFTELYTFYTQSDDGVRLWVNGQLLIDQWNDHSNTEHKGTIALEAGDNYSIVLEFYENGWNAVAQLRWSSARQARQIIPRSQLYPTVGPALPTVSVTAPDATAAEASLDPGIFRFTRTGDLSQPLSVSFTMGGSAANGDYDLGPAVAA